jgi:deazaflavin-dependent oxidoreductase (nitroreductase family)
MAVPSLLQVERTRYGWSRWDTRDLPSASERAAPAHSLEAGATPGAEGTTAVPKDAKNAFETTNEIEITVIGRRSGRRISNPVWFVQEGEKLYLVPVTGSDSDWYKNVRKTPTIRLAAKEAAINTSVTPITDAAKVGEIVDKFRDKYGANQVETHYPKPNVAVEVPLA